MGLLLHPFISMLIPRAHMSTRIRNMITKEWEANECVLYQDFPHPMQSCKYDIFPFTYADFSSLFVKSRAKKYIFSTCMHLSYYTSCVYAGCTTITRVHQDLCPKMKNGAGFPSHDKRSMILGLPYTGKVLNRPFSSI
jgi:hypothetical protein